MITKTEFFALLNDANNRIGVTAHIAAIELANGHQELIIKQNGAPNAFLSKHKAHSTTVAAFTKYNAWLNEWFSAQAEALVMDAARDVRDVRDANATAMGADVVSCTIHGKEYWRTIEADGTRSYYVATQRRNQYGLTVKRKITTDGTQQRIEAELVGGVDTVKRFLAAWLSWAEDGAVVHGFMDPTVGLCSNLAQWCHTHNIRGTARLGLMALFKSVLPGRDKMYPFGKVEYARDLKNKSQHTNEKRLAWVREMLK